MEEISQAFGKSVRASLFVEHRMSGPPIRAKYYSRPNHVERFWEFLELISRFEFDFHRRGNFSSERFELFGVQSSITCNETAHVHVLWPVCTNTIPFRMLWCP